MILILDYIQNLTFHAPFDSRFTYCFIGTAFVLEYNISTNLTLFVELRIFNNLLNNIIFKIVFLPIIFPLSD